MKILNDTFIKSLLRHQNFKTRIFATLLTAALMAGCGASPQALHESYKQELSSLHAIAYTGSYEQAIEAGEKALKMMDLDDVRDADQILKDGEENFTFEAFDESLRIFAMALLKNKNNTKAKAYLALLSPLKNLKGIYWRMSKKDDEDWLGFSILESYRTQANSLAGHFTRFTNTPFGERLTHWGQAQKEVFIPFAEDLIQSSEVLTALHDEAELDIYLHLPKVMSDVPTIHMRNADAMVASSLDLGIATYAKIYTAYDFSNAPFNRTDDDDHPTNQSDWLEVSKDPQFGLIADRNFLKTLKGRYFQFAEGVDLAYAALKQREADKQNEVHDFAQLNNGVAAVCTIKHDFTRVNYEAVTCSRPHDVTIANIFSFTNDSSRIKLKSKVTEREGRFEPSVDEFRAEIDRFKKMFFGPIQHKFLCEEHHVSGWIKIWIDLPTYMQNPIDDLKTVGPLFDGKGQFRNTRDKTLHGLFPQGIPCGY